MLNNMDLTSWLWVSCWLLLLLGAIQIIDSLLKRRHYLQSSVHQRPWQQFYSEIRETWNPGRWMEPSFWRSKAQKGSKMVLTPKVSATYALLLLPVFVGLLWLSQVQENGMASGDELDKNRREIGTQVQMIMPQNLTDYEKRMVLKDLSTEKKNNVIIFNESNFFQLLFDISSNGEHYRGKKAEISGYLYQVPGSPTGHLYVIRYVLDKGSKETLIIGMPVVYQGKIPLGKWVSLKGVFGNSPQKDAPGGLAIHANSVKEEPEPKNAKINLESNDVINS